MTYEDVTFLRPEEPVVLDASLMAANGDGRVAIWADDAVEDMVIGLAAVESAWAAGEFTRLETVSRRIEDPACDLGVDAVVRIAGQLRDAIAAGDDVATAALVARLVRVGEAALATILEIAYRQV